MPGPSFRPFLGAFGVFLLFLGLVFGGWLLVAGVIALIATLVGWLIDARKEYRRRSRRTRPAISRTCPPRGRRRSLFGVPGRARPRRDRPPAVGLRDRPANGAAHRRRSGAPPAARRPRPARPADRAARASAAHAAADVLIEAKGIQFVETSFTAPADKPFTIAFDNQDQGTPHNIEHQGPVGRVGLAGRPLQRRRRPRSTTSRAARRQVHVPVHRPPDA